ncbi:MAG TPA: aminoacyl-tRNA hydrolase [Spirochaetota bacterium]|nr:aminoacyl-tRNA hydrolase [Spirochaetota bacterium]HPJ33729.1 aminoacyl-tRNA hydrolase [Spirochaetota bacterium]
MIILAFLGNPGRKYSYTRHNIGFMVGEHFAGSSGIKINKKTFSAECGTGKIDGQDTLLLFPQTFMNLSGKSVAKAMDFYDAGPENLIVIHDELELTFGDIRTKLGGGHKGHNGLRSIIAETGSADFHRIRFGIGRPENPQMDIADHVLSRFSKDEQDSLAKLIPAASELILSVMQSIASK